MLKRMTEEVKYDIQPVDLPQWGGGGGRGGYSLTIYCKIPKINPGAYIFQRPFLRGLSAEGNLRFKIDWASHKVGSKFTHFRFVLLCI